MTQNAWQSKITSLYHYQPFKYDWLMQTILGKIYCSNPNSFNDPWDCRPTFYIPPRTDTALCEKYVQWFDRVAKKRAASLEEHEKNIERLRTDRAFFEDKISQFSPMLGGAIGQQYRVYCLSSKPDNILMWSHYGSSQQGICLEFDARDYDLWSGTQD